MFTMNDLTDRNNRATYRDDGGSVLIMVSFIDWPLLRLAGAFISCFVLKVHISLQSYQYLLVAERFPRYYKIVHKEHL